MSIEAQKTKRDRNFNRWWRVNHHRHPAHLWLVNHAKRVAYGYMLAPAHHDDVMYITKRFFKSEYQRLSYADAWCLWKAVHPLVRARLATMQRTADRLIEIKAELKQMKRENKAADSDKKTFVVERKTNRVFKSTS